MPAHYYYTLMASLPYIPPFDRVDRLPINRDRLDERLQMLEPEDRAVLAQAEEFIEWQRQPADRTDADIIASFQKIMEQATQPILKGMMEYRMIQRTIVVALRCRHRGLPCPSPGQPWGIGPRLRQITQNWEHPEFKLGFVHPWIRTAREYLETGQAIALEQLLMNRTWTYLERIEFRFPFRFEAVLSYLFKWDIVQRWLLHDQDAARISLQNLIEEGSGEYRKLF